MKLIRSAGTYARVMLALACLGGAIIAGCGGGSGPVAATKKVSAQTRTRVTQILAQFVRALAQSGVQTAAIAVTRNGAYSNGSFPIPPAGFGGAGFSGVVGYGAAVGAPAQYIPPMPMLGAFIFNVAAHSTVGRSAAISRMVTPHASRGVITRGAPPAPPGSPGASVPPPAPLTFYFDDYLGLWVDIQNTATQCTYTLYVDQAKTQPAGSIVTTLPSGTTYPQVYSSTYNFTAGLLAGAHGSYQTSGNQDGSGNSSYTDTYSDGSNDSGTSNWTAQGDFSWSDQATDATGAQSSYSGAFHADGSGTTHATTSDGYTMNYTYNADGSGSGTISGPAAGLPATVTWDIYGDTTITYADGTVDYVPGWTVPPVSTGTATATGSGSGAGTTSSTPPPPPGH